MSARICPTCHQPGHSRTSHRNCLANPKRLASRQQSESEDPTFLHGNASMMSVIKIKMNDVVLIVL